MTGAAVPPVAFVAALAGLAGMGPARLTALLDRHPPAEAWQVVAGGPAAGDLEALAEHGAGREHWQVWRTLAGGVDVDRLWGEITGAGLTVVAPGDTEYPTAFTAEDEPEPPAVIFAQGSLRALDHPRVAVVGTRRCTGAGRELARQLGYDLAGAGVCVVSGLALGIDGAAHAGALDARAAPPAGVVATGLDVIYPRRHVELWARVAEAGVVLSEYPLGTTPERWRFPARNRLVAALADVLVVVESHAQGGSMHTVESALARQRVVMAVPGPVRSPASAGTNALLAEGAAVARDADDVLVALGLSASTAGRERGAAARPEPDGEPGAVLAAVGFTPVTLQRVGDDAHLPLATVAVHLVTLERDGWISRTGGWYERTSGSPL